MYGTQTRVKHRDSHRVFENDVKMYGTQTEDDFYSAGMKFENDVKMYGTQTPVQKSLHRRCLRMM